MNIVRRRYSAPQGNWLLSGRGKTHILAPGHGTRVPYRASFAFRPYTATPPSAATAHACMHACCCTPRRGRQTGEIWKESSPLQKRSRHPDRSPLGLGRSAWRGGPSTNARPSWDPVRNARLSSSRSRPLHILSFRRLFIHQSPPQKRTEEKEKAKRLPQSHW